MWFSTSPSDRGLYAVARSDGLVENHMGILKDQIKIFVNSDLVIVKYTLLC
jgi:hypothetical protein